MGQTFRPQSFASGTQLKTGIFKKNPRKKSTPLNFSNHQLKVARRSQFPYGVILEFGFKQVKMVCAPSDEELNHEHQHNPDCQSDSNALG